MKAQCNVSGTPLGEEGIKNKITKKIYNQNIKKEPPGEESLTLDLKDGITISACRSTSCLSGIWLGLLCVKIVPINSYI